jgi:hypothetical protein
MWHIWGSLKVSLDPHVRMDFWEKTYISLSRLNRPELVPIPSFVPRCWVIDRPLRLSIRIHQVSLLLIRVLLSILLSSRLLKLSLLTFLYLVSIALIIELHLVLINLNLLP